MAALIQRQFVLLSFVTAFLFVLTGVMAISGNKAMLTSTTIQRATSDISSLALLTMMGKEIPALNEKVQASTDPVISSFTGYFFQLITGIQPGDIRSLVLNEIPGLSTFNEAHFFTKGEAPPGQEMAIEYPATPGFTTNGMPNTGSKEGEGEKPVTNEAVPTTDKPGPVVNPTTSGMPVVFIYHTHNRESWLSETKREGNSVNDKTRNITLVGRHLADALKDRGIGTEVNTDDIYQKLLDSGRKFPLSYAESLKEVEAAAKRNHELRYFFDLHRDDSNREETTVTISEKNYARIKFVIGMGNKNYEKNTRFAQELKKLLEKKYPGITRDVDPKSKNEGHGEYNQSISPGSLLLEIGGTENTPEECFNTADAFAAVFAEYYWQAEKASAPKTELADKR